MKKLIAVIVLVTTMVSNIAVSAASPVIVPDAAQGAISVSGTLDSPKGNATILLRFLDENGSEVFVESTNTVYTDDGVTYDFGKIYLPADLRNGTYTIEVSGVDLPVPFRAEYMYSDPYKVLAALKEVAGAEYVGVVLTDDNNADAIALGIDITSYISFSEAAKTAFETVMGAVEYELPEDDNDTSCNERELARFKKAFKNAVATSLLIMVKNKDDVEEWFSTYYNDEDVDIPSDYKDIFNSEETGEEFLKLFNSVKSTEDFTKRMVDIDGYLTFEQISKYIIESTLLTAIYEKTATEVEDIITNNDYNIYFDNIDLDGYGSLSNTTKKNSVLENFKGVHYDSMSKAVEKFNELVINEKNDVSDKDLNSGGGGGGGGGGRGGANISISAGAVVSDKTDDSLVFTDLKNASWAEQAILYLYNAGVVNGRSDKIFAPNDSVTRAEFVKMVISAMGISAKDANTPFFDVSEHEWFAPYVAAAYRNGIVNGDANGNFNPNALITRQDMVTILYRAVGENISAGEIDFADASGISAYARDAVAYFSNNGIVNGMGDGTFSPEANATRAQTAVILYRLMTS